MNVTAVPLKVSEVLVPKAGTSWNTTYKSFTLLGVVTEDGYRYWTGTLRTKGGTKTIEAFSETMLRNGWQRKSTFFRVGKTYKFQSGRNDQWTVWDIYSVENPAAGASKRKAVAKMTAEDGTTDIQTLNDYDFERMVEV